jgi:chlorite dismutase
MSQTEQAPASPAATQGQGPVSAQTAPLHSRQRAPEVTEGFANFQCWKISPEWRRQEAGKKAAQAEDFLKAVRSEGSVEVRAFSTAGLKAEVDFILWAKTKTPSIDGLHSLGLALQKTEFSRWNALAYNYSAMLKGSPYAARESGNPELYPGPYRYLFVYPFVKTRAWYVLPLEERMRVMRAHIETSKAFPQVKINTSYSFGIDDQDFVVAFESNEADAFVNLVQKLRETESSLYTQRDTPMYVGVATPLEEILKIY